MRLEQERAHELVRMEHERMDREARQAHELLLGQQRNNDNGNGGHTFERAHKLFPKYGNDKEPIDVFLNAFERIARLHEIPENEWATHLASLLCGKALDCYNRMDDADIRDYSKIRSALYQRYEITPENHRIRFREMTRADNESYAELGHRMATSYNDWMKGKNARNDAESMSEVILLEQLYSIVSPPLKAWLHDRTPATLRKACGMADEYLACRNIKNSDKVNVSKSKPYLKPMPKSGAPADTKQLGNESKPKQYSERNRFDRIQCYTCKNFGHLAKNCTQTSKKGVVACVVAKKITSFNDYMVNVEINGQKHEGLRDSGADFTLCSSALVKPEDYTEETLLVRQTLDEGFRTVPIAIVDLKIGEHRCKHEVGVWNTLPFPVILGNDLKEVKQLHHVNALTRAAAKKLSTSVASADRSDSVSVGTELNTQVLKPVVENVVGTDSLCNDVSSSVTSNIRVEPLDVKEVSSSETDAVVMGSNPVCEISEQVNRSPTPDLSDVSPVILAKLQEGDETLKPLFALVGKKSESEAGSRYFLRDGVLMREWTHSRGSAFNPVGSTQVCVPQQYRAEILALGHSIPSSGHLGVNKTKSRILNSFYWPQCSKDVSEYVRSCHGCQLAGKAGDRTKAPMVIVPPVEQPFTKVSCDVVGPLPTSTSGSKYILTIIDHGSRYPEAIPIASQDAETVANELILFFTKFGFPTELLTDLGSNFTSLLFEQLTKLCKIKLVHSSVAHPQSNGINERMHGTLKRSLRAFASEHKQEWDKLLPFLMFAIREVPNRSLGFSPFELLFAHDVKGPLSLIQDSWLDH